MNQRALRASNDDRIIRSPSYRRYSMATSFWTWPGWTFFVAVGTLGLAFFTWRVARQARDQIKLQSREVIAIEKQTAALTDQTQAVREQATATGRQVEVSSASLEAASRPVLVGAPLESDRPVGIDELERVKYGDDHTAGVYPGSVHYQETDQMIYCSVPVRNVGAGVAFLQNVNLVTRTEYPGRVLMVVVPPDETTRVTFAVARRRSDGSHTDVELVSGQGRGFALLTIRLVYTGASRDLVTTSEITAAQLPAGSFIFTEQKVWDGLPDEGRLLASTDNIG